MSEQLDQQPNSKPEADKAGETPEPAHQELIPAAEVPPVTDQPPPHNMEVHHHAHHDHGKKTWRSYFWEFFMLFLAVFCGSLAELQVEHYIEHQREKKYAATLIEDLSNDTADLNYDIEFWTVASEKADKAAAELEKPYASRDHIALYKSLAFLNTNNTFLYHDRTIQQLKSAGNFRLIRDKSIADSLIEYDAAINTAIRSIETGYQQNVSSSLEDVEHLLFNVKYFNLVRRDSTALDALFKADPRSFMMLPGKEDLVFRLSNKIYSHQSINATRIRFLRAVNRRAANLISMLKKEYPSADR